jgi:SAM-dependent methyltransferase
LKATLRPGEISVLECGECTHTFARPIPASGSPSASAIATESLETFTASLIGQAEPIRKRQDLLARNRAELYLRTLGPGRTSFRILEVGCGSGGLGRGYTDLGHDYLGLDIDARVIDEGRRIGVNVRHLDVMDLDRSETFDVVFMSQVLEHILEPGAFLTKVRRHLRHPGLLHLDVPSQATLAGRPSVIRGGWGARYGAINYPHHCMAYSSRSLGRCLSYLPDFESRVFTAACDHELWGQARGPGISAKAFYRASQLTRRESLLVAVGRTLTPS